MRGIMVLSALTATMYRNIALNRFSGISRTVLDEELLKWLSSKIGLSLKGINIAIERCSTVQCPTRFNLPVNLLGVTIQKWSKKEPLFQIKIQDNMNSLMDAMVRVHEFVHCWVLFNRLDHNDYANECAFANAIAVTWLLEQTTNSNRYLSTLIVETASIWLKNPNVARFISKIALLPKDNQKLIKYMQINNVLN